MSVYAKTQMETMPGSCTECKFGERYGFVGDVKCRILREYFTGNVEPPYKERPDACPLVEKDGGRLVELPCKVGETVYANFSICGDYLREKDRPYPCEVVFIGLSGEPFIHIQFPNDRVLPVNFDKIGKTVFLTKEAAEAALKEQEG